jgi:hypothetical protein
LHVAAGEFARVDTFAVHWQQVLGEIVDHVFT